MCPACPQPSVVTRVAMCSFSVFEEMHATLLRAHVGDLTMRVVDLESRRHSARMDVRSAGAVLVVPAGPAHADRLCVALQELRRMVRLADAQQRGDTELEAKIRAGEDEECVGPMWRGRSGFRTSRRCAITVAGRWQRQRKRRHRQSSRSGRRRRAAKTRTATRSRPR